MITIDGYIYDTHIQFHEFFETHATAKVYRTPVGGGRTKCIAHKGMRGKTKAITKRNAHDWMQAQVSKDVLDRHPVKA